MVKRELTLAEGLKELKIKLNKADMLFFEIRKYSSKMKDAPDIREKQQEHVRQLRQAAEDTLRDINNLKMAIQTANLEATFEFNGKTWTLAEAIYWKQTLKKYYENLWDSFTTETADVQIRAWKHAKAANLSQEDLATFNIVPHLFYNEDEIKEKKYELLALVEYIDALIDKVNHSTLISY